MLFTHISEIVIVKKPSQGNFRTPNKENPYGVALRSMWNTRDAVLEAPDYLDDPKVAAEIDALQSDWYQNDLTDVYQTKQGQRTMNFNPQPGSLTPILMASRGCGFMVYLKGINHGKRVGTAHSLLMGATPPWENKSMMVGK
jgi:hypothetical protein